MDGEAEVMDLGIGGDSGGDDGSQVEEIIPNNEGGDEAGSAGNEEAAKSDVEGSEQTNQDGRQVAAAIKNHLAELKRTNPALEKQIRGDIYAARAARELGPIPELRALKESVELYGGTAVDV